MVSIEQPRTAPSWRRVEIALIAGARKVAAAFDHRLAQIDLNLNQASLLAFVNDFGESNQTELAEMVGIGRASIGSMIDRLEARGLVTRNPHPNDRRVWLVGITSEGTAWSKSSTRSTPGSKKRSGVTSVERNVSSWHPSSNGSTATSMPSCPHPTTSKKEVDLMHEAVIVDVVRTPAGKRNGKLKDWHPADLGAHVLKALEERTGIDPAIVDDVVTGCVSQVGQQAFNLGRNAVLAAGWPESVPATTVDRQCGSSQQAIHFAAQGVMAGAYDVVVALGVEVMTTTPMGASGAKGELGMPFGPKDVRALRRDRPAAAGHRRRHDRRRVRHHPRRPRCLRRHRASSGRARATAEGRFENEIVPVPVEIDGETEMFTQDEGIRPGTTAETLANLKPAFDERRQDHRR